MMRCPPIVALAFVLSGCVPPGVPENLPPTKQPAANGDAPRISDTEGVFDAPPPVWEKKPVRPSAQYHAQGRYIVQPGDNLFRIGEKADAGVGAIARANSMTPTTPLRVGQRLVIPAGRYHRVASGESGIAIARAYGVQWAQIVDLNALSEPYSLRIGQRLLLPGEGEAPVPSTPRPPFKLEIDDILTGGEPATDPNYVPPQVTPSRPLPPTVAVRDPTGFSGIFDWPAYGRVQIPFGPLSNGERNDGVDISVAQDAPIVASGDGVVAFTGTNVAGYGGLILIRHGRGWITAYGRAASSNVVRGQTVRKGQTIGRAGRGATPLLHFEMRQNRRPVNPLSQLPQR